MCRFSDFLTGKKTVDRPSPSDWIKPHQIFWNPEGHSLTICGIFGHVWITGVQDTKSMDGLLDYGHTVILVNEFDRSKLQVGDIVVYRPSGLKYIIHRIVQMGEDKSGRWYRTKGDNNATKDPYLLRDAHLAYLCIGIIY